MRSGRAFDLCTNFGAIWGTMLIGTSGPAIFIHYHKLWNLEHAQPTFNLRTRFIILIPPSPRKRGKNECTKPLKTLKSNYFYIKMLFFHSIKFLSLLMQSNSGKLSAFLFTSLSTAVSSFLTLNTFYVSFIASLFIQKILKPA